MKFVWPIIIAVLLLLLGGFVVAEDQMQTNQTQTIVIGGLLPLSGNASAQGPSYKAAMELAAEDLNAKYATLGLPYQVRLRIADTGSDPDVAKKLGTEMIRDGIHFIIGPLSSAEMTALEETATQSHTILIGFGSTAPGLTSQNNTIVRLCPDDTIQAQALQGLFKKENYSTIIPVVRNDIYGQKFYEILDNLSENGTFTLTDPIYYEPGTASFNTTIEEITRDVHDVPSHSRSAVLVLGFDETADILNAASQSSELGSLSWVGTDGIALSDSVLKNRNVAAFAAKTNFTATIYGEMENEPKFMDFSKRIQNISGLKPTPYAVVIDDAVQLAALTEMTGKGITDKRPLFLDNADHFYGVSGYTFLTESGDRRYTNIDFWRVKDKGGDYSWTKIGRFVDQMAGPMMDMKTT
ncbi:ABC transporter substrate-binding protein [Methanosphaerula palustris]|uniref:Extracellular ligand-binding receptor n=1 Tax=Methanosphaerula palustris (strain ATCC BAA-1556 / DSM 19958 / E1-9c) TaxID=521011 RepID=B8GEN2_METPE|nr:ABC transporter substrate-binding protein [Methanosphaerula palustris]ACL17733.1 Extracellular ligand-binding receptor [Methanosphaerula palustris E1-9c]